MQSGLSPLKPERNQPSEGSAPVPRGRVSSRELLGKRRELIIEHEGRKYRLRFTQNGKLILTA
jgi:hemin uptake protein HemP